MLVVQVSGFNYIRTLAHLAWAFHSSPHLQAIEHLIRVHVCDRARHFVKTTANVRYCNVKLIEGLLALARERHTQLSKFELVEKVYTWLGESQHDAVALRRCKEALLARFGILPFLAVGVA